MGTSGKKVVVIDDDEGVREAVARLLAASELAALTFESAEAFLDSGALSETAVLILDIQLPGLSGLGLQRQLVTEGPAPPAIFITGQDLPRFREEARVLDCPYFTKPFPGCELIKAVLERLPTISPVSENTIKSTN